jgi:hypothetical protein
MILEETVMLPYSRDELETGTAGQLAELHLITCRAVLF